MLSSSSVLCGKTTSQLPLRGIDGKYQRYKGGLNASHIYFGRIKGLQVSFNFLNIELSVITFTS